MRKELLLASFIVVVLTKITALFLLTISQHYLDKTYQMWDNIGIQQDWRRDIRHCFLPGTDLWDCLTSAIQIQHYSHV